jgi:membrane associated rhomboid family serine protease
MGGPTIVITTTSTSTPFSSTTHSATSSIASGSVSGALSAFTAKGGSVRSLGCVFYAVATGVWVVLHGAW